MGVCEVCGNEYERTFEVSMPDGSSHVFDSFECAINALAPKCPNCSNQVIGHGVEADQKIYCSVNCAREYGVEGLVDSVSSSAG